jgi:hypothetical protein
LNLPLEIAQLEATRDAQMIACSARHRLVCFSRDHAEFSTIKT